MYSRALWHQLETKGSVGIHRTTATWKTTTNSSRKRALFSRSASRVTPIPNTRSVYGNEKIVNLQDSNTEITALLAIRVDLRTYTEEAETIVLQTMHTSHRQHAHPDHSHSSHLPSCVPLEMMNAKSMLPTQLEELLDTVQTHARVEGIRTKISLDKIFSMEDQVAVEDHHQFCAKTVSASYGRSCVS